MPPLLINALVPAGGRLHTIDTYDRAIAAHTPRKWGNRGRFVRLPEAAEPTAEMAGIDLLLLAYGMACVFGAAIVRGYSGFGFSLLTVTALSLTMAPTAIVPVIFMMEIAASLHLLPGIWREVHWRSITLLLIGCVAATPLGVWILVSLPPPLLKILLAIFVGAATILLWRGFRLERAPGTTATIATGAVSGLFNGAISVGGPPVVLFYFSSPAAVNVGRASIIAYFLFTDLIALAVMAPQDLIDRSTLIRFVAFLPALIAGIWVGARSFRGADPAKFRRWVLVILFAIAVLTGIKGALELTAAG